MRQRVLSVHTYRGLTLEHVEEETFRGTGWGWGANHAARYVKYRYWWIRELEWDEPTFREACAEIDSRYPGSDVLVDEATHALIARVGHGA